MQKLTPETQKVLTEGEQLQSLVKSDGWRVVRRKFNEKVIELSDILLLDATGPDIAHELRARQRAIEILIKLMQDVEGSASQYESHAPMFRNIMEEELIHHEE